ncbi:hypothetical protein EFR94_03610 [Levilactobacillus brevis]|nr:hypothetical protein [Levilactobacillus brevis]
MMNQSHYFKPTFFRKIVNFLGEITAKRANYHRNFIKYDKFYNFFGAKCTVKSPSFSPKWVKIG